MLASADMTRRTQVVGEENLQDVPSKPTRDVQIFGSPVARRATILKLSATAMSSYVALSAGRGVRGNRVAREMIIIVCLQSTGLHAKSPGAPWSADSVKRAGAVYSQSIFRTATTIVGLDVSSSTPAYKPALTAQEEPFSLPCFERSSGFQPRFLAGVCTQVTRKPWSEALYDH